MEIEIGVAVGFAGAGVATQEDKGENHSGVGDG